MSDEVELTPELARKMFARKNLPQPEPDSQAEPSEPAESSEPGSSDPAPPDLTPPQLSANQLELCRRYGLTAEDVKRVRGATWAEKCEDAARLAELARPGVNEGELAALAAYGRKQSDRSAWWLGGGGQAP
jgi:hypothetical protein